MLKKLKTFLLVTLVILITCSVYFNIYASTYPEKNVEIIVTFSAGGSTDTMMRVIAVELEKRLGKRFIIVNKPGAGGEIGWTAVYTAKADGYTICNMNTPSILTKYITRPTCKFVLEDFTPIANIVTDPGVLTVSSNSSFKTLEEYISYAKENPGALTCSHEGIWGDDYIALKAIEREADVKLTEVQFDGDAPARVALLGGHIASRCGNASEAAPMVEAGKVRVLAVMSEERLPSIPDVPTFKEEGYNIVSSSSRGIGAPKGISEEARNVLIDTLGEIVNDPEFIQKMKELKMNLNFITGEDYYKFLKSMEKNIIISFEKTIEVK